MKYFVLQFCDAEKADSFRCVLSSMGLEWHRDEACARHLIVVTSNISEEKALRLMEAYDMFDII